PSCVRVGRGRFAVPSQGFDGVGDVSQVAGVSDPDETSGDEIHTDRVGKDGKPRFAGLPGNGDWRRVVEEQIGACPDREQACADVDESAASDARSYRRLSCAAGAFHAAASMLSDVDVTRD